MKLEQTNLLSNKYLSQQYPITRPRKHIIGPIGNIGEIAIVYYTIFITLAYLRAISTGWPSKIMFASV